jgi:teichuronic acid biosynthesis glycosyltransferase TuaG
MLIVDDASEDGSAEVAKHTANRDSRVRLTRVEYRIGGAEARNHAISEARGRYLAFLDADDFWMPYKLSRQLQFMKDVGAGFAYTGYEKCDEEGKRNDRIFIPPTLIHYKPLLRTCVIGCSTVILDRTVVGRRYMPLLPSGHDFALWLDILRDGYEAHGLPEPLTVYRERGGSLSANKLAKSRMTWHIYRQREGLGRMASTRLMASYAWNGFRKRLI